MIVPSHRLLPLAAAIVLPAATVGGLSPGLLVPCAAVLPPPDDIRAVASPVIEHRLLLRPESELEGMRPREVLDRILHEAPVPR